MSRFPRYLRRQLEAHDHANVERAIQDATIATLNPGATAGGDTRKLRGIPAIGRNVRGAIPGTIPGDNLMRR